MTLRRLQEREGTLVQVRQFLWDEIGLKVYDYYLCKSHIITYISHVLLLHSRIITSLLLLMFKVISTYISHKTLNPKVISTYISHTYI